METKRIRNRPAAPKNTAMSPHHTDHHRLRLDRDVIVTHETSFDYEGMTIIIRKGAKGRIERQKGTGEAWVRLYGPLAIAVLLPEAWLKVMDTEHNDDLITKGL